MNILRQKKRPANHFNIEELQFLIIVICSTHNFNFKKFLHITFGPPYETDILYLTNKTQLRCNKIYSFN